MINIDEKTENQTVNNAKIKEQDVKIDSLQSAVNVINGQITAIQTSISSINSTITDKYNAQTQKLVNDLSTAINALKAELANTVSTSQLTAVNADADTMTVNDTLTGSNIISDTLKVLDNAEIAEETVTKSTVSELIADVANLVEATIETLIIDNITTLSVTADNGNIATLAATVADIATLISPLITATKLRSDIITGKDWVTPTGTPDNTQLLKIEIPAYNGIVNFITQDNEIAFTIFNNTLISINQNAQYLFNVTFNEAKTVLYFGNTGDSMPFKILYQGSETLVNPVTEIVSRVGVKNNINFKKGVITSENIHSTGGNQIQISLLTVLPASGVSDVIYIVKNDRSYIWDEDTTSFIAMGGDVPAEAKLRADADDALSERITTNATSISANTANIATNTASISTINGTLSGLSTDVATNTANIATNAGNISTNANAINTINGKIPSGATSTNKLATASDLSAERTYADETFQPKLTPGSNISITDNVIACDVSTMNFKGAVETFADLPTENLDVGDVYNIISTTQNVCWDGTKWVTIGSSVDISGIETDVNNLKKVIPSDATETNKLISEGSVNDVAGVHILDGSSFTCVADSTKNYEISVNGLNEPYDGLSVKLLFSEPVQASNNFTVQLGLNGESGTHYPIKSARDNSLVAVSSHLMTSQMADKAGYNASYPNRWCDAYTTMELVYSATASAWIVIGNPIVMSYTSDSASYEIKANGLITQSGYSSTACKDLPVSFSNSNYHAICCCQTSASSPATMAISSKKTSSRIVFVRADDYGVSYFAQGF